MHKTAVAALAASVVAVAGCGGSGGGTSNGVAGVRASLHEFAQDLLNGNYAGACDLFTASARAKVGGSNCANLLGEAMKSSPSSRSQVQQALAKTDSWPVSVHGDTATTPNVNGGASTTWVKQGGRWLIGSGVGS